MGRGGEEGMQDPPFRRKVGRSSPRRTSLRTERRTAKSRAGLRPAPTTEQQNQNRGQDARATREKAKAKREGFLARRGGLGMTPMSGGTTTKRRRERSEQRPYERMAYGERKKQRRARATKERTKPAPFARQRMRHPKEHDRRQDAGATRMRHPAL